MLQQGVLESPPHSVTTAPNVLLNQPAKMLEPLPSATTNKLHLDSLVVVPIPTNVALSIHTHSVVRFGVEAASSQLTVCYDPSERAEN